SDALATALVKIAYGLARAGGADERKRHPEVAGAGALGIFDARSALALATASAGRGRVSTHTMQKAMRWDLWNPWARWIELGSTHPLPAKRIRALERMALARGARPSFSFGEVQPESYWDEFLGDVIVHLLPALGFGAAI